MDALQFVPVTMATTKAGLAAGTTSTFTTANTVQFAIRGKAFSAAGASNVATPVLDRATGLAFAPITKSNGAVVVFAFDATGAVRCSQGAIQALDVANSFVVSPQFPVVLDTDCPFGYLVLKAGTTAVGNFVFGTNNLSAVTGMVYTFVDILTLTDRPQVS